MITIKGIAAAPGIAVADAFLIGRPESVTKKMVVADVESEWQRASHAMKTARSVLLDIVANTPQASGDSIRIIESNSQILADPELQQTIHDMIYHERVNAEWAVHHSFAYFASMLESHESDYVKNRAIDLLGLSQQVVAVLQNNTHPPVVKLHAPAILVAATLPFTDLAANESLVRGICLAAGNRNDHAMIMARSLGIPGVLGIGPGLAEIKSGSPVVVDGDAGEIIVDPDQGTMARYRQRIFAKDKTAAGRRAAVMAPVITRDGCRVEVMANVSSIRTAQDAWEAGADGIGLVRSEFLFASHHQVPSEDEQYAVYQQIADTFPDREITFRLFDAGSDKPVFGLASATEANPALGMRGIRLALAYPDLLLKPQLRALLRIKGTAIIKIMLPMVTQRAEIVCCKQILADCRRSLTDKARAQYQLGIMIEVPSAAIMADELAREVDFFSIGTNDLSQYLNACDRTNPALAGLEADTEMALLRVIRQVIRGAHRSKKSVSLCGEWGHHPLPVVLLVGMGIDQISVNPNFIAAAKMLIAKLNQKEVGRMLGREMNSADIEALRRMADALSIGA